MNNVLKIILSLFYKMPRRHCVFQSTPCHISLFKISSQQWLLQLVQYILMYIMKKEAT